MVANLNGKLIGDGQPTFVVFEAGPTHGGFEGAQKLITAAASSGADAIKFQIFPADKLVADAGQLFSYSILIDKVSGEEKVVQQPLLEILKERELTYAQWADLKKLSDDLGLLFFATVGFDKDIDFLADIGCASIKIASADVNHFPLIRKAARTGLCIQLDTGNATIGEIETAVDVCQAEGNENIVIHQCPSGYPARLESVNLRIIPTLKEFFGLPIAYSDHVPGWEMDIAAIGIGANMVEKTVTLDRTTPKVEHIMSIEPNEMVDFVASVRRVDLALGVKRRHLSQEERKKRTKIMRSPYFNRPVAAGEIFDLSMVDFRRPGIGLSPEETEILIGGKIVRDISSDQVMSRFDVD